MSSVTDGAWHHMRVQKFAGRNAMLMAVRAMEKDLRKLPTRVKAAAYRATQAMVPEVRKRVPVAFGELKDSIHAEDTPRGPRLVADAPHAAVVEYGSRPHMPPLGPILRWVKLRGMQGLTKAGRVASNRTKTGRVAKWQLEPAKAVAGMLAQAVRGGALDIDAPMQVARAIQMKIAKEGTRPQPYMRTSIKDMVRTLDLFVRDELAKG